MQLQFGRAIVESARIGFDHVHRSSSQHIGRIRSEIHQSASEGKQAKTTTMMVNCIDVVHLDR